MPTGTSQRDSCDFIPSFFFVQFPVLQFGKQPWTHPTSHPALCSGPWGTRWRSLSGHSHQLPFAQPTVPSQPFPHPSQLVAALLETRCSNSAHKPAPAQTRARFPAGDWLHEGTFTAPGESRSCQAQVEFLQHLLLGVEPPPLPQLQLFTKHPYRHSNKNIPGLRLIYT